jgi:conjugal transfer/entry exclusion protein
MHAEHAELISALRAENQRLTVDNAQVSELRTIIDAQDRMLSEYEGMVRKATATNDQLIVIVRELREKLEKANKCP